MLAELVRCCRATEDLAPVLRYLGYEEDRGPAPEGWRPLGRWHAFRVIGAAATEPVPAARAMARRLAATAQPGLVITLGTGTVALAAPRIGTAAASAVLAVSVDRPDRVHLQLLAELAPRPGSTALEHALLVGETLATEGAGTRFFDAFRTLMDRAQAAVPPRIPAADRTLLALLPLTRVLFLYFVQAKGWLDGRPDFLRTALDDALAARRRFHRSVLQPLCFGTLNRPPDARTAGRGLRIPYLNGGLFEPHPVERLHGPLVLPNAFWRDGFADVFERFRFCVREGEHVDAIAPDTLGRVFERVMHVGERKASGTFYTPEHLVRALVIATLETAIGAADLPLDTVRQVLTGQAPPHDMRRGVVRRLARLRVLDPAAGSGAFLLGALDVLTDAWGSVGIAPGPHARVDLRRRIVARQIFGVDVAPLAVRLAELRLWLALIADDPERNIARITPLPNLNGVVRQGDSLLDPVAAARVLGVEPGLGIRAVRTARSRVFAARGAARGPALAALRDVELQAARSLVQAAITRTEAALRDLLSAARTPDLFGRRTGLSVTGRARHRTLRAHLRTLRAAARRIAQGTVPFFSYDVHCPEVTGRGGFDAVVGNPPWVRAERLPAALRSALAERFGWWRTVGGRGFAHQPDLAVAFLQRAVELAAPGGAVGFLVPSKVTSAGYAEAARRALVRETTLTYLHRVPDRAARAFGATVYPLAIVLRKAIAAPDHQIRLDFDGARATSQRLLSGAGPWVLTRDRAQQALQRLQSRGPTLGSVAPPILGVKTGADHLLVGTVVGADTHVALVRFRDRVAPIERALLRPALRGRDIRAFRCDARCVVFWPYDDAGALRPALPRLAKRWVQEHRSQLVRRSDFRREPAWTLFRVAAAFARHPVVWPDLAPALQAVATAAGSRETVPLNTCYVSPAPGSDAALVVASALNSTWIRVLVRARADEARGGYRRHNARVMRLVPVPDPTAPAPRLLTLSRRAHETHDVSQQDLDRAVAEALRLDTATRADLAALAADLR